MFFYLQITKRQKQEKNTIAQLGIVTMGESTRGDREVRGKGDNEKGFLMTILLFFFNMFS